MIGRVVATADRLRRGLVLSNENGSHALVTRLAASTNDRRSVPDLTRQMKSNVMWSCYPLAFAISSGALLRVEWNHIIPGDNLLQASHILFPIPQL